MNPTSSKGEGTVRTKLGLCRIITPEPTMTPKNVALEPELFARITAEAAAEGTTADELTNEAAKRYLALRRLTSCSGMARSVPRSWGSPKRTSPALSLKPEARIAVGEAGHARLERLPLRLRVRRQAEAHPRNGHRRRD